MAQRKTNLVSWNVNGIRAVAKKSLGDFLQAHPADIYCFQEIKAGESDIHAMDFAWPEGYERIWYPAEKKGYSGTGVLTRLRPQSVLFGLGEKEHDREGRMITLDMGNYFLVNVYTPNAQPELTRLDYRVNGWDPAFRSFVTQLAKKKTGGDLR
jgi:exodeoxyribonuclease-3